MDTQFKERFQHYLTGVPKLDDEHYAILNLMFELECSPPLPPAELATKVQTIIDMFRAHLVSEELMMDAIEYPFSIFHKMHHAEILRMLMKYNEPATNLITKHSTRRISDHLFSHIDHHDSKLADYIRNRENASY